ncbi:MAG: NUDIX domain-containing protein [Rhodobacteraceae bacterium]|nr:NUDIX domain-containing protein [Paracoccaceae bacterium]
MFAPPPTGIDITERTEAFKGYFKIERYKLRHELFEGGWSNLVTREVFERGHAAAILPYDPHLKAFVLCRQFRIGAHAGGMPPWQIELVAGIIEDGEKPEDVARREAVEEAGVTVSDVIPISHYAVSPGGTSETVYLYLGRVDSSKAGGLHGVPDEDEHIEVQVVTEDDFRTMIDTGVIANASTLLAGLWFFLNRDKVIAQWT